MGGDNSFAKRQRETLKRQKAEEKRERRRKRKDPADHTDVADDNTNDRPAGEP